MTGKESLRPYFEVEISSRSITRKGITIIINLISILSIVMTIKVKDYNLVSIIS